MKSISKDDSARLADVTARLATELTGLVEDHADLLVAIGAYNARIAAYNEVLAEAEGIVSDVVGEIDAYMEERSEKWLEGDAGEAYGAWKDAWEEIGFDTLDAVEEPDLPEPDHIEALNNLPSGPDA